MNAVAQEPGLRHFDPWCDQGKLAAIGQSVRTALARVASVRQMPTDLADIYQIDRFLTAADCKRIIQVINAKAVPSTLFRGFSNEEFRTSHTHHFEPGNAYTTDVVEYLCALTGLDILHAEWMQGQRYQQGQQYRHHHDWFPTTGQYWDEEKLRGGQRTWTAMINLNEPREGGETDFPHLGLRFAPRTGQLLLWDNMARDGSPNMKTLHAGLPVLRGIKHVITLWFRQEPTRLLNVLD
jgi:prolyl 4-hydroxylase